jgi:hypothetical protein
MDYRERVDELMNQVVSVQDPDTRIRLVEEAIRLADSHGDVELGFGIREQMVHEGTFNGFRDRAIIAFSWLMAQCDKDPEKFNDSDLLWQYKWVAASMSRFPTITRAQMESTLADMSKRYERNGIGLRPVAKLRCMLAMDMGDREAAAKAFLEWQTGPRSVMSDCPACETDDRGEYFLFAGKLEEGLAAMKPILSGRMNCAEIPHATYGTVLVPLAKLGRWDEAEQCHRNGYRLVSRNHEFTRTVSEHLVYVAMKGDVARSMRLIEAHLDWMLRTPHEDSVFWFANAARFALSRLTSATVKLRLPAAFPADAKGGTYDVARLRAWFAERAGGIAKRFNERNGNDWFTRIERDTDALADLKAPATSPGGSSPSRSSRSKSGRRGGRTSRPPRDA